MSIKQKSRGLAVALAGSLILLVSGTVPVVPAFAQSPNGDPNVIPMQGNLFVPAEKTVVAGTTLTWVNMDAEEHDVLANDGSFSSPQSSLVPGASWSFTFTAPGTYSYVCDFHVNMEGVINVTPAA